MNHFMCPAQSRAASSHCFICNMPLALMLILPLWASQVVAETVNINKADVGRHAGTPARHRLLHEGGYQMIHETSGALSFLTPKGNRISEYPQPVTSDKSLEVINQQARLNINPETAIPNWHGEVMDLNLAVSGMYALAHKNVLE